MSENNDFNVPQTASMSASSSALPENPSGDMQVKTPYDYLKEAFAKEVESEPITLEVKNRPGIYIEFNTNITSEEFDMWRKQATVGNRRRNQDAEVDSTKFSALVIFHKAIVFKVDGEDVYLDEAQTKPLNFYEQSEIRNLINRNITTNTELVRAVYGNDAHVLSTGQQIIEAAGYGEEMAEFSESPTKR